jgi:hypothetical protein
MEANFHFAQAETIIVGMRFCGKYGEREIELGWLIGSGMLLDKLNNFCLITQYNKYDCQ